jgi:ribosomal protein S18 acetylase RimI-like enzyme
MTRSVGVGLAANRLPTRSDRGTDGCQRVENEVASSSAAPTRLAGVVVSVGRVRADEGPALKAVRLAALLESPSAFGSTHGAEAAQPDEHWALRAARGASGAHTATYFAVADGSVIGIATGYRPDPAGLSIELVSMWVSPPHRRAGIARKLIDAVTGWAIETDATSVDLWVTRGNDGALSLYEAVGFRETGEHQPLPSDPSTDELRMRCIL